VVEKLAGQHCLDWQNKAIAEQGIEGVGRAWERE